jgi:pantetheine-phosphate adenylyltransferase
MKIGIVAGSFDPITNGHTWLIGQSAHLMHKLYVVIGVNPSKKSLFTPEERKELVVATLSAQLPHEDFAKIRIRFLEKELLINFAMEKKAHYIFRGIRTTEDFNYEAQMQLVNRKLSPEVETLFMIPPRELTEVSSSTVKGLMGFNGWEEATRGYVSAPVLQALVAKLDAGA